MAKIASIDSILISFIYNIYLLLLLMLSLLQYLTKCFLELYVYFKIQKAETCVTAPFVLTPAGLEGDSDLQFLLLGGKLVKVRSKSWKHGRYFKLEEDCQTFSHESKKAFKQNHTCECYRCAYFIIYVCVFTCPAFQPASHCLPHIPDRPPVCCRSMYKFCVPFK